MILQQKNERDLLGGRDMWASIFPFMDFGYFILGWFTVTIEVFLRRDFGERYFNKINFIAGFLILGFWALVVGVFSSLVGGFNPQATSRVGTYGSAVSGLGGFSFGMVAMWFAYTMISMVHFTRIWWRNRTNQPLHSLDPGRSRLEWLGKLLIGAVNAVASIPVKLFAFTLSEQDKVKLNQILPIITDSQAFTERFLEPTIVWILGLVCLSMGAGVLGFWLIFGAVALSVYTNYRYEAERHQFLDIRDQFLEAQYMPDAIAGVSDVIRLPNSIKETVKQTAKQIETSTPQVIERMRSQNPTLTQAMAALNPKLRNIANGTTHS